MNVLIENTSILSMEDDKINISNIYIENDLIKAIGYLDDYKADRIIDGSNYLTMPGFINSHTHVAMSHFRNYGNDTDLMTWLNDYIFPAEEKLNEDIVYNASLLSFVEMIKSGTTSFADMYFFEEETIKALEKSKLRAQIARGLTYPDENFLKLNENIDLFKKYNNKDDKLFIALGPHAIYTNTINYLKEISKVAKEFNMPIHIHLSETKIENDECIKKYGKTPTEVFDECGIFDQKTIAAHGVYLTDNDLSILKEKNVSVVHNPSSNLKLSSGILDVTRLLDYGINVCLGTDSAASNNKQSMLKEIEICALLSKLKDASNLKAFDVLKMATINGAKALGIDKLVGTIKAEKKADLIMINTNNVNHFPTDELIASVCYSTYERDIEYVFVDGDLLLDKGKLTYLDEDEILKKAKSIHKELL